MYRTVITRVTTALGTLALAACASVASSHPAVSNLGSNPAAGDAKQTVKTCLAAGHTSPGALLVCVEGNFPGALTSADLTCLSKTIYADHKLPKGQRATATENGAGTCLETAGKK